VLPLTKGKVWHAEGTQSKYVSKYISNKNNVKMTLAYNSAYVQIETLNFTFTWQAVIVYFDVER